MNDSVIDRKPGVDPIGTIAVAAPGRLKNVLTDYKSSVHYLRDRASSDPEVMALSPAQREAEIFRRILMKIPVGIVEGESLAGDYGTSFGDAGYRAIAETAEANKKKKAAAAGPTELGGFLALQAQQNGYLAFFTRAHTSPAYDLVLAKGLNGIIAELEAAMATADDARRDYLAAEIVALRAVIAWSGRFADLGFDACRHVPAEPARTFHEAVQSLWLVHTCIGVGERGDGSLSLGRIDQYLYPFYEADRARGVPAEDLADTVTDLVLKLNRYADASGAANLGGVDAQGNDLFNDLSRLIVKVCTGLQVPAPILAARIHPGIRQDDFDLLTDPRLIRMGQPSFYGEFSCRGALRARGIAESDVHRWAVNSCMGMIMPGEEFSDMWGGVFYFLLPLELALNKGRRFHGTLPLELKTVAPDDYANVAEIMDATLAYAKEILGILTERHRQINQVQGETNPDPYLSALLRGGELGRDRLLGGPRYHTAVVDTFGLVNAADAIAAIDRVVFQERSHALQELVAAAINDFAGQEALRLELIAAPKFGNADAAVDRIASELASRYAAAVRACSDHKLVYLPSFHTLNYHVSVGGSWGASLDGRRRGEPFAKNIGPMQGRNKRGITSVMSSALAVDQQAFCGGQALDLYVEPGLIDRSADRAKLQAALQTYFRMGGLQVQVNGADVEMLKDAMVHPEKYPDLTIRIGGFSARFVTLLPEVQRETIRRFEAGT